MMTVSHGLSGALIAAALPNPLLYVPLALACHYFEDSIYHWDFGTGMNKTGARSLKLTFAFAVFDAALAIALIAIIWKQTPNHFNLHIWLGAFFCVLPDLVELPKTFLKKEFPILKPLEKFHNKVHRSTKKVILGVLPQVIVIVAVWLVAR